MKVLGGFAAIILVLVLVVPALATTEHCPDGGVKVNAVADELNDIIPVAGTLVCVKGSTDATGILTADGLTSLVDILGNGHDVSYYVTYGAQPSATPSSSPSASPTVTPGPTITPAPSPSVVPSATPTFTPTPSPSVSPTPTATPPTPTVSPSPTAVPTPSFMPLPTPPATDTE